MVVGAESARRGRERATRDFMLMEFDDVQKFGCRIEILEKIKKRSLYFLVPCNVANDY